MLHNFLNFRFVFFVIFLIFNCTFSQFLVFWFAVVEKTLYTLSVSSLTQAWPGPMEGTVLGLRCALPLHPLPLGRALLLLQLLLHPLPLFLLLLHLVGMTQGLGLLRYLLLIHDHPGGPYLQPGPGLRTRASHLVRGHRSPIPHLFRVQLMTSPRIYPLLLLSDAPSSIATQLQAIQFAVPWKCTARYIMIF